MTRKTTKRKTKKRKTTKPRFDKIQTGSTVRKFDGKRYNQSGSYRTKSSAIKAKKFAKENSGLARIVKMPKGYVVYTNYSKTGGKLKKRKK